MSETKIESIIGKRYVPFDNSYSVNLTKVQCYPYKNENPLLLGCDANGHRIKKCVIASEPFICKIPKRLWGEELGTEDVQMIIVESEGESITTMYSESSVI